MQHTCNFHEGNIVEDEDEKGEICTAFPIRSLTVMKIWFKFGNLVFVKE